jgi:uncharacterized protein (DUF983 family)
MASRGWVAGLLLVRCPVCRTGRIFRGPTDMNPQCPECRYVFQREPGYFLGSLVIGYVLAIVGVSAMAVLLRAIFPALDWEWCFFAGFGLYLPFVPAVFRYSRASWMYFDHWLDPPGH